VSIAKTKINNVIGGLVTESSPLTAPPNTAIDINNIVLNKDGTCQRRLGLSPETDSPTVASVIKGEFYLEDSKIKAYVWNSPNNYPDKSLAVYVIGGSLYFFDASETLSLGSNYLGTISLFGGYNVKSSIVDLGGKLIVGIGDSVYSVEWNGGSSFTSTKHVLYIRDFYGYEYDDALKVPVTYTDTTTFDYYEHLYNSLNSGWTPASLRTYSTQAGGSFAIPNRLPPLNSQPWIGKDSNSDIQKTLLDKQFFGDSRSPQGKYVIPLIRRSDGRTERFEADNAAIPISAPSIIDIDQSYIADIAHFSGRVFYAFYNWGGRLSLSNVNQLSPLPVIVGFSQVVEEDSKIGKLYQEADPTAEYISDLVESDGGIIPIVGAGSITALVPMDRSLLVFASNGVWEIIGGENGFSATSYYVKKITTFGTTSKDSIVVVGGSVIYWTDNAIYSLEVEQVSGYYTPNDISTTTIKSFYDDVSDVAKSNCYGIYDKFDNKVIWMYNSDVNFSGNGFNQFYDKALVLDLTFKAFLPISLNLPASTYVSIPIPLNGRLAVESVTEVVTSTEVVADDEQVVINGIIPQRGSPSIKYSYFKKIATDYSLFFAEFNSADFKDFSTNDAPAYFETGEFNIEDTTSRKGLNYLTVHCKRTETGFQTINNSLELVNPGSVLLTAKWDYANHSNSGKITSPTQVYRLLRYYIPSGAGDPLNYGTATITTKNNIRGSGRSLRLRFETEPAKDFYLYGWAFNMSSNDD